VHYVDHKLQQEDYCNSDEHLFLRNACYRFGLWFSPPEIGVSQPMLPMLPPLCFHPMFRFQSQLPLQFSRCIRNAGIM
jgi:hypothetical protein